MTRSDRILIAAGGGALVLAIAAVLVLLSPAPADGTADAVTGQGPSALIDMPASAAATEMALSSPEPTTIVVDVEGAVMEPGIRDLPADARVADAVAAAGGYAADADLDAAAVALNLAERLTDGAQIVVPRIGASMTAGEPQPDAPGSGAPDEEPGGPVNLNTASAEQLEALPGIGPVTVDRIIAARDESPFTSLEDAVERGVLDRGQLRDLQGLATAG